MSDAMLSGSCLCGGVAYEMRQPYVFFHYCHCRRCRKSSGSAHSANIMVRADQFAWTKGEELVRRWELPDAKYYCTGWCSVCGSSVPWQSRNGKGYVVPVGTLDDDPGDRPTSNIHWDSRASWYVQAADLPTFAEGE